MLDLLMKYARDHGLEAEPGFDEKDVRWVIACDSQGGFLEVVELGDTTNSKNPGRTFRKCPDLAQRELIADGLTRSHFLVDTAEVVAVYDPKAKDPRLLAKDQKVNKKHAYFVGLLGNAGNAIPELKVLAESLSEETTMERIRDRLEALKVKTTDKVTFSVGGAFPLESDCWHEWWRQFRRDLVGIKTDRTGKKRSGSGSTKVRRSPGETSVQMRCFATGQTTLPVLTHLKIKGLNDLGKLATGDVLIGFDKDAFCSYGLPQSTNAAVSEEAAAAYRAGLNNLIKNHGNRLAGPKVIHWFNKKVAEDEDPLFWLSESVEQQELDARGRARKLLESIRTGERPDLSDNHYYALTLSGGSGRVMVRDWMEGQFEDLVRNVWAWFDNLSVVHREGNALAGSPKFMAVMGATVRDLDDLVPPFVTKMWRVAVRNEAVPQWALAGALRRTRIGIIQDEPFNHARMGLMKAYHLRKYRGTGGNAMAEELKPVLNENHPDPAYQCGRLMAVLARLQRSALGDVGAGVVQRYYAAACSTPSLVLGRITRLSQFHLNKLDPGLAHWYESQIAGIWGRMRDSLPRTLDLEGQSLFALGYYQQIAHMRSTRSDKAENEKGETNE